MKINLISSYDLKPLLPQKPEAKDIQIYLNSSQTSDLIFIINHSLIDIDIKSNCKNIFLLHQEPNTIGIYNKNYLRNNKISKIFTHTEFRSKGTEAIKSHPGLPWSLGMSHLDLSSHTHKEDKNDAIVMISSNKRYFSGHISRLNIRKWILHNDINVHLYGRGYNEFLKKESVLSQFKYSIEVENILKNDYWTEKLSDCFLMNTLPIYQGCPNLTKYFPKDAFINANGCTPNEIVSLAQSAMRDKEWERRQDALAEAKRLVLEKYSLFPTIFEIAQAHYNDGKICTTRIHRFQKTKLEKLVISTLKRANGHLPLIEKFI